MYKVFVSLAISLLFAISASASFLPPDLKIDMKNLPVGPSNIDQNEFNQILEDIRGIYSSKVSSVGGRLSLQGQWNNDKPNARATQMFGTWRVEITGGLARRPELTADGFALIVCHELGHHMGGYAFAPTTPIPIPIPGIEDWAAAEGQSDYYATQVCARRIWGNDLNRNAEFRQTVSDEIRQQCDGVWQQQDEQNLCYRTLAATESMIATMAALMQVDMPSYSTPDTSVVDKTVTSHPQPQCRMDTSLQGALCAVEFNDSVIPGKGNESGSGSADAERDAFRYSCSRYDNHAVGPRPQCWFKSQLAVNH